MRGSGRLQDLPGVGDALAERLEREFGSAEAFLAAARDGDVVRIAAVEGVGERRAVDLALHVQGVDPAEFLRTPRARALHEDIVERIRAFAATDAGRARVALLQPLRDRAAIEARLAFAVAAKEKAASLPAEAVSAALARVSSPRTPRPKFDSGLVVLVDSDAEREKLVRAGVDRHCRVATAEDGEADDFELVVYAYTTGSLDLSGVENVVAIPFTEDVSELVPETTLRWFRENRALWDAVVDASALLGWKTALPEALEAIDRVDRRDVDWSSVEARLRDAADRMNAEMKRRTSSLSLGGDEVLEMMAGRTPRKIRDAQAAVLQAESDSVARDTGDVFHVFTDGFPVAVDEDALASRRHAWVGRRRRQIFREKVETARALRALRVRAEEEVRKLVEFDFELAVGRFGVSYDLRPARFGRGFRLEGALHLALPRDRGVPVDYELGGAAPVALLTGANSGGKTTLLETIAQVALLAHMGLPVPARGAVVEHVEGVWFFTQKRSLDAGAFESFLRSFVPIVTSPARKLVLADEIEAMTELDAAARIVGTFLEMLRESGSCGVCVSHLAEEISRHTAVRIDGIEARGLDEHMELVVDRTPRMGFRAKSTPELILRKLASTSGTAAERDVFERILKAF